MIESNVNTNINTDTKYHFKTLEFDKIDAITDLFNTFRNRNISYSFFRHKYAKEAINCQSLSTVIQDDKSRIVGHLGVLPEAHCIDDQIVLGGQISDAVLATELRGKQMFTKLIQQTELNAVNAGIQFLWVAPSPQAIKGFTDNNWIKFDTIRQFTFKVRTIPLNKISNKFRLRFFYEFYIRLILFLFCKKSKALKNPNVALDKDGVITDADYVKQKNYTRNYLIRRKGFKVWLKIEDGLEIGNVEFFEKSQTLSLIKTMASLSRLLGCHQFRFITTEKGFLFSRLEGNASVTNNDLYYKKFNADLDLHNFIVNGSDLNTF